MNRLPHTCFIRNVAYEADAAEVKAAFERQVGGVLRVYLAPGEPAGTHKGYGFVSFENEFYLQSALNDDGLITLAGRQIFAQPAHEKKNPSARSPTGIQSR
jgi:RNA recognition motif-containing protein